MPAVVLGPDGRDLLADADQWMVEMLFGWLSDRDLVGALVEDGVHPNGLQAVWTNLKRHIEECKPYEREPLRREVLTCLKSRKARHHIHRLTCDSNLAHYEQEMADWRERLHLWLQTPPGRDPGEKPERPPDPPNAKEVGKNLQRLQAEIEKDLAEEKARSERLIVT